MLTGLEATKKEIGEGVYGKVVELRDVSGKCYAAKQIVSWEDVKHDYRKERQFTKKYEEFSKLRHPNLVEFHGFYKPERSWVIPLLVMERMKENLTSLLERSPNIEIAYKLTILLGVAEGLNYLHSQNPPIVHGRLSSNNILLNNQENEMQVKIGDVGITTMMLPKYKPAIAQANFRSTADFLPPLGAPSLPSLDVFSYGRVMLHTMTQEWPNSQQHVQSLMAKIKEERVEFVQLVKSCVGEKHEQRPVIVTVLNTVQKLCNQLSSKSDEKSDAENQPKVSNTDLEKEEVSKAAAVISENEMPKQAVTEVHNITKPYQQYIPNDINVVDYVVCS